MGVNNKPQEDAKSMRDEYIKGATIADIALKYNHSESDVTSIVTSEPTDEVPAAPVAEPAKPVEAKKDK